MGKVTTVNTSASRKMKALPYEIPAELNQAKKEEEKGRIELNALLCKLDAIIPCETRAKKTESEFMDLMENAINYICDLEDELGPDTVSFLHSHPDFYKMMAKK